MPKASEIKPQDLAIALSLLEGDQYKMLVPSDYIAHLRRHPGYNNVRGAYTTNNRIVYWVKESILHYDRVDQRVDVLKFFIHTAQVRSMINVFFQILIKMFLGMQETAQLLISSCNCICIALGSNRKTPINKIGAHSSDAGKA